MEFPDFGHNMWKHLGIEFKELNPGHVKLGMKVKDELLQSAGVMHGGATASLIDSATWVAVWSMNSPTDKWTTTEMKVNYLAAAMPGDELVAESRVIHNGRSLAVSTAEVRNQKGKMIGFGTATFLLLK